MTSTANGNGKTRADLTKFAWLSIAAAILTIGLKAGAYFITGSVGLLSDAAESTVNLVAAIVALVALRVAAQPHSARHHYGRTKAEYLSAGVEGIMIFIAAIFIIWTAVDRLLNPEPIHDVGVGLGISVVASIVNGSVAWVLMKAGREHNSITLIADGKHLLTDVWTSVGVLVGVLLVAVTGWLPLDPIVALLVGLNIIWTGSRLVSASLDGLLDHAMNEEELGRLRSVLHEYVTDEVHFHSIRTRVAGHLTFIDMHMLVPGGWTVQQSHDRVEEIENRLRQEFGGAEILMHVEPIEDPASYEGDYPGLETTWGLNPAVPHTLPED